MSETPPDNNTLTEELSLDQNRQRKAMEYSSLHRRLSFIQTGFSLVLLLVILLFGVSIWFSGIFMWPKIAVAVISFLTLMIGYEVLISPLSYYRGFILPHRYGLSIQKLNGWLIDRTKSGIIGLILSSGAIAIGYWLLMEFPDMWWLIAWILILLFSIFASIIAPVVLVPLFYKVKPLADINLQSRLEQLARKAGARVNGIFTLDFSSRVTSANAALMGMGKTRRIVLSDTLVQQYPSPEIEVVTAHEIGHHIHRDIFRLFIFQAAVFLIILKSGDWIYKAIIISSDFSGIADPAALPVLLLIFGALSMLLSPLQNAYTRYVERQADAYALSLTDGPEAFINAMTRLANQNLAVAYPARWQEILFYDHPSYHRRVEHAREYKKMKERRNN